MKKIESAKLLKDFVKYCKSHKEERFWQALRNWANVYAIYHSDRNELKDTFYFINKND